MQRRTFNKLAFSSMVAAGLRNTGALAAAANTVGTPFRTQKKWPDEVYRRLLTDTHIPDWDPVLLSKYDAAEYARAAASADFQEVEIYANSHVGLCLWPTKIGKQHGALKGRDFVGDTVRECHRQGLYATAYYSLVWDIWAYQNHPDWRIVTANGKNRLSNDRTGVVCPNSPYREHAKACLQELVGAYDFAGIFLDMTFWPEVCYCHYCQKRFHREHKADLPRIVDWDDPVWRSFQAARQAWMLEFAKEITQTIKSVRPITVAHQYSVVFHDWKAGIALEQNAASDYSAGDFYGGPASYSLACKLFGDLSAQSPIEFHTSRTIGLGDFETVKSPKELTVSSLVDMVHSGSCVLIDSMDPDGTFNRAGYSIMKTANDTRKPYEPFLGGELVGDIAIYYDRDSLYDPEQNRIPVLEVHGKQPPHLDSLVGVARILTEAHIPYGAITNATLGHLDRYRAVYLPDVLELTEERAAIFREFVRKGGVLFASGHSSLQRAPGFPRFLLEDVFGVRYQGTGGTKFSYLTPASDLVRGAVDPQQAVSYPGPYIKVEAAPGTTVLATSTLPFADPESGNSDNAHFAQIWNNPPAEQAGTDPGITMHGFGKGTAVYLAAPIERQNYYINKRLVQRLILHAMTGPNAFEADTLPSVELTLYNQPASNRFLLSMLNLQIEEGAAIPESTVRVRAPRGKQIAKVLALPEQKPLPISRSGDFTEFKLASSSSLAMALVVYA